MTIKMHVSTSWKGEISYHIAYSSTIEIQIKHYYRFMRGDFNIRARGVFDILTAAAPATPGTASSIRTNPPNYQRMHSNDSNKGNEVKDS